MKKLFAVLGMITCMIGMTACGSTEETTSTPISEEQLIQYGEQNVASMQQIISQNAEAQYEENEIIYTGLTNMKSAMEDIGDYQGTNGGDVVFKEDEIVVNINVLGSEHNAVVEMIIDEEMAFTSISTNVTYSTAEKMEKAALNTLLGMGTVFVVLILMIFIISAFSIIPKIQAAFKKKPEEAKETETDNVVAQIVEKEELSDDLELVAVISAAIAAYEGSGSTDGFVVRSIRKANKSKWQNA
ncbi:MAG: OadG family protein [Lachnospiraceae bacterium]|nr:OadG family protein [Lachnospiraceae bacterium]